jgi:hypothetical protein
MGGVAGKQHSVDPVALGQSDINLVEQYPAQVVQPDIAASGTLLEQRAHRVEGRCGHLLSCH